MSSEKNESNNTVAVKDDNTLHENEEGTVAVTSDNKPAESDEGNKHSLSKLNSNQRIILATLCLLYFALYLLLSLMAPMFPIMAKDKGVTPIQIGMVVGVSWLVMFLSSPILGYHVSTLGPRNMAVAGIIVASLVTIFFGLLDFIENRTAFICVAMMLRVFEGLGIASFTVAAIAVAATEMTESIQMVMGVITTVIGLGVILSPLVGGALYSVGGFPVPFFTMGTIALLCAPIGWYILRNCDSSPEINERQKMGPFLSHFGVFAVALHVTSFTTTFKFAENYIALHVHITFQYGPQMAGLILSVACICFAVTALLWAALAKVLGCKIVMVIACGCGIIACLFWGPIPFMQIKPHIHIVFGMSCLYGTAMSGATVPAVPELIRIAKKYQLPDTYTTYGLVSAIYAGSFDIGCFVGPLLGGALFNYIGFAWSTSLYAGFLFITGSLLLLSHILERRQDEKELGQEKLQMKQLEPALKEIAYTEKTHLINEEKSETPETQ